MSGSAYIDTAILGAYYFPEAFSDEAETALRELDEAVISELTEVEFFSLTAKKLRIGDLPEADVRRVMMKFENHLDEGFYHRVTVETADYRRALGYLAELNTGLRTVDSLHIAIADRLGLELITSDKIKAEGAEYFGVEVRRAGIP